MNYDEITKITAERISDYMTEAVNTDSIAVAEMFHNAAWGVRTLWFELVTKIDIRARASAFIEIARIIETEQVHCCIVFSLNIESRCPCTTIPFVSFIIAHFP
ncbi:hypothetical protein ICBEC72H_p0049 (plasmid) [Escherichia coli]|uniref:Stability (Stb) locus n=6 Tax=Enterobacterales TaxID=91347 RepID=A0A7U1HRT3_ECOLX|nr:hypothetical protein ICBEC72H_p0049 [Escherichia coli]QQZ47223.1 stability (stb) locus [Escherichia coli]SRB09388.1 Uncharacterised protein [Escherichia coli]STF91296.1 Uncharacterised protein [Escherichia coli]